MIFIIAELIVLIFILYLRLSIIPFLLYKLSLLISFEIAAFSHLEFRLVQIISFVLLVLHLILFESKKNRKLENDLTSKLIIGILVVRLGALCLTRFQPAEVLTLIRQMGYDQVGHLAILQANRICKLDISNCNATLEIVPNNYEQYPQLWHKLFSFPLSEFSIGQTLTNYYLTIVLSEAISLCMIIQAIYKFQYINCKRNSKINSLFLIFITFTILILSSQGYPNFVFACSAAILGTAMILEKNKFNFEIGTILLIVAMLSYSLFLPVLSVLVLIYFTTFFVSTFSHRNVAFQKVTKFSGHIWQLRVLMSLILFVYFGASILTIIISERHYSYLLTPADLDLTLLALGFQSTIFLIGIFLYKESLTHKFGLLEFLQRTNSNLMPIFVIFASNSFFLFYSIINRNNGSYYLQKYSFFALIFTSVLFCGMDIMKVTELASKLKEFLRKTYINYSQSKTKWKGVMNFGLVLSVTFIFFATGRISNIIYFYSTNIMRPVAITLHESDQIKESQKIINLSSLSAQLNRAIVYVNFEEQRIGPNSQWIGALSKNWSEDLQMFLQRVNYDNIKSIQPVYQTNAKFLVVDNICLQRLLSTQKDEKYICG